MIDPHENAIAGFRVPKDQNVDKNSDAFDSLQKPLKLPQLSNLRQNGHPFWSDHFALGSVLAPRVGLEPTTHRLTADCSAD